MSGIFFLILSIACSTLINVVFKIFAIRKIDKLSAIVVNYLCCFSLGFILSENHDLLGNLQESWFQYALSLGVLFVLIFFSMAMCTEKLGISVNAVSSKMSVVIPLFLAFLLFNESFSLLYALGLILSLISIYLVSVRKDLHINKHYFFLPVIVFVGSGIIDLSLKVMQDNFGEQVEFSAISYSIFLGAFLTGLIILIFRILMGNQQIKLRNLVGGVALGIPNYFSILFLLEALAAFNKNSALVFSINNVSIVLCSTILSILIFKEQLSAKNKIGLFIAVISILIISYAKG